MNSVELNWFWGIFGKKREDFFWRIVLQPLTRNDNTGLLIIMPLTIRFKELLMCIVAICRIMRIVSILPTRIHLNFSPLLSQENRPIALKKENIQTRNRKTIKKSSMPSPQVPAWPLPAPSATTYNPFYLQPTTSMPNSHTTAANPTSM